MLASVVRVAVLADSATTTHVAVWSAVEVAVGIVVACLPALRTLARKHGGPLSSSTSSRSRENTGTSSSRTTGTRQSRPDWICLDGDVESARNKNRDTIKSHSTILTVPTIEELEEIVCDKEGTPPVRSIDDLQRFHDSVLFGRDPNDMSTRPSYEWSFDKVQWRYNEAMPPSPITVNGLGVIPDITAPNFTMLRHGRPEDQPPPVPPVPPIPPLLARPITPARRSR
ncbi:hypothetical protein ABW19_dt0204735 [Dactylella cylindrospora]|nr:hypothetical protein ABW19_dt0204735 [Dactylella cylindrospora]